MAGHEGDARTEEINEKIEYCVREGIKYEEVKSIYTYWPACYDEELLYEGVRYEGPQQSRDAIMRHYPDQKDAYLLDVCAGTGIVGQLLKDEGYTNLDALDGSKYMLTEAKKKGLYKKYIVQFLGPDKIDIEDNVYDGIVSCGCWHSGHVETGDCFLELVRIVKPGGWIVFSQAEEDLPRYEPKIRQMEKEGKWKWEESHHHESYCSGMPGVVLGLQVC